MEAKFEVTLFLQYGNGCQYTHQRPYTYANNENGKYGTQQLAFNGAESNFCIFPEKVEHSMYLMALK
jgi:hypothetical protein